MDAEERRERWRALQWMARRGRVLPWRQVEDLARRGIYNEEDREDIHEIERLMTPGHQLPLPGEADFPWADYYERRYGDTYPLLHPRPQERALLAHQVGVMDARHHGSEHYIDRVWRDRVEKKFFQNPPATALVNTTSSAITTLTPIGQGSGDSERNGNNIVVTDISLRVEFVLPAKNSVSPNTTVIRFLVWVNHSCNGGGTNNPNDFIDGTWNAYKDPSTLRNYTILIDEFITLHHNGGAGWGYWNTVLETANTEVYWSAVNKFRDWHLEVAIPVKFSDGVGSSTSITTNNIACGYMADIDNAGAYLNYRLRVRYYDDSALIKGYMESWEAQRNAEILDQQERENLEQPPIVRQEGEYMSN